MPKLLELDKKLVDLGLKSVDIAAVIGVLCGGMVVPGSERSTHYWLQHISALGELIVFDFSLVTLDRLYKASEHLLKHKEKIEEHLRKVEISIFGLEERIILYDLSNTFFEGSCKYNPKAKYGRSKEKRNDCPLVTLGLALDMQGFPKRSRIFEGNVSEPGTLETMIKGLSDKDNPQKSLFRPTIVMDAGITTEDNVQWLKDCNYRYKYCNYRYIVVSRKKKREIPDDVCWKRVRTQLSSHIRVFTILKRKDGRVVHIRKSSRPESNHKEIYDAIGLPHQVGKTLKVII